MKDEDCAKCGGEKEWEDCYQCGGDGVEVTTAAKTLAVVSIKATTKNATFARAKAAGLCAGSARKPQRKHNRRNYQIVKNRTIVEEWDGPVVGGGDRYFEDLDSAVEWYWDDCFNGNAMDITQVPEFIECCDEKLPVYTAEYVIETISENIPMDEDAPTFADSVSPEQQQELQALIDDWIKRVDWKYWQGNGKHIALRPLVEEYEKVCQHRNSLCDAMTGFKATSDEY